MTSRRDVVLIVLGAALLTVVVLALAVVPAVAQEHASTPDIAVVVPEPAPGPTGSSAALLIGSLAMFGAFAIAGYALLKPAAPAGPTVPSRSPAQALLDQRTAAIRRRCRRR